MVSFAFGKAYHVLYYKYIFKDSDIGKLRRVFPIYFK